MNLSKILKQIQSLNKTLIDTTIHTETYFNDYAADPETADSYYLGIKYGTLKAVSEDVDNILGLVEMALRLNAYKWSKLWETTTLEYNPIWNYDGTNTITEVHGKRHEKSTYGEDHATTDSSMAPFDSPTPIPTDSSSTTRDERSDEYDVDSYTDTITEVKGGNQGTTTTQQMIREERAVADFKMLDIIMADIIQLITYPYYEEE